MTLGQRTFGAVAIEQLSQIARLELDLERREIISPTLQGLYALIDTLDQFELGETPPAQAFDARWE